MEMDEKDERNNEPYNIINMPFFMAFPNSLHLSITIFLIILRSFHPPFFSKKIEKVLEFLEE
jgi:hypothetical protein